MKKHALTGLVCLFILLFAHAFAENRVESVSILPFNSSSDHQSFGYIEETAFYLNQGEAVSIDMSAVFDMYPEHTGIYGYLYAPETITIVSGESTVTGQGVMEFSFPGAQSCTVTGFGQVYAYFLPVPYKKLSTTGSLLNQSFDLSYLTQTAVGHSNMFMLADPQVYVFQENIPYVHTVYKYHSLLGPVPHSYQYMDHGMDGTIFYSYVSERPVLVQCGATSREIFETDVYHARKMAKVSSGNGYEIWAYQGYQASHTDLFNRINQVFTTSMKLAEDEFLSSSVDFSPIVMVLLGEELRSFGAAGMAVSDEKYTGIDFRSFIFVDANSWENYSEYLGYLFAHELGHIIQHRTLSHNTCSFAHWFQEGFATFFGEKVSALLGDHYKEYRHIPQTDAFALKKFLSDMVFNISNFEEYQAVGFDNADILMLPHDPYSFGSCFMYYLEEKYGTGFYKGISNSFYQNWYKGHEDNFFYRRNDLDYNIDKYYSLIKEGLSPSVYLDFPAYMEKNYCVYLSPEPDMVLPAQLTEIDAEAFSGVAATHIRISDGTLTIGANAFSDCTNLATIRIPASVTAIADNAFNANQLVIFGTEGSYAQAYAQSKGYTFMPEE